MKKFLLVHRQRPALREGQTVARNPTWLEADLKVAAASTSLVISST
jgi:hypothetical protein